MSISQIEGRIVAALATLAFAVGMTTPPKPAPAPTIEHPCSKAPQTAGTYTFPIPATNPAPVDPIAVVPSKGGGSFVNTVTKARFVPRGAHYVRLATVKLSRRYTICMSSDFDVGTGLDAYNPHRAAQALSEMQGYGYNEVSVGLNPVEIGNPSGSGLDPTYLADLASFVNIARADGIRVSIDLMSLPQRGGYLPSGPTYSAKTSPKYHNTNLTYIDVNFLAAQKRYISDVITGLSSAGANLSNIFSFELTGEVVFRSNQWPLNLTRGFAQTDGQIQPYNMADPSSRTELIDANLLHWENQLSGTIHAVLPKTLVSVGFFAPYALVRFPSDRISRPELSLGSKSNVDFVDLHTYPIFGSLVDQVKSFGVAGSSITKPIIMGEFGEYGSEAPTPAAAAAALVSWQQLSCHVHGFQFSGWVTWTWDTIPSEQSGIYNMVTGHDAIAAALAPRPRWNPCR